MNFSEIIQKIKDFFSSLKSKIIDFYNENRKLSLIISALILLILICIILLICIAPKSKKDKSKEESKQPFVLTETLQIPNGPQMPDDYNISRKTESSWSEEEAEPWFTIPSEKEINALSQTNNTMINELLGAAPWKKV